MTDEIVLVTGASGFIGKRLCQRIIQGGGQIRKTSRNVSKQEGVVVGELGPDTDWSVALENVGCVVHLAARVHVMCENAADSLSEFNRVNVLGTLNLARQAAEAGVRRFIFVSSIKVNGEQTEPGVPFVAEDIPSPKGPYATSKWEAEQGLFAIAAESEMEVVIIRPPLVYGPGVKANFLSMMKWVSSGVPLPLGAIHNQRTFIALDNLVDLVITCIANPRAGNHVFLAGDGEDLSTTELLRRLGKALDKRARLLPVPVWLLEAAAAMVGKRGLARRLCGSLQIDISETREILGWTPPVSVNEGLRQTVAEFIKSVSTTRF